MVDLIKTRAMQICGLPANGEGHHAGDPDCFCDRLIPILRELEEARGALEWDAFQVREGMDIDGGDWQDEMERRGILVQVPADEWCRSMWETDVMYVLAWSNAAREAESNENADHES